MSIEIKIYADDAASMAHKIRDLFEQWHASQPEVPHGEESNEPEVKPEPKAKKKRTSKKAAAKTAAPAPDQEDGVDEVPDAPTLISMAKAFVGNHGDGAARVKEILSALGASKVSELDSPGRIKFAEALQA